MPAIWSVKMPCRTSVYCPFVNEKLYINGLVQERRNSNALVSFLHQPIDIWFFCELSELRKGYILNDYTVDTLLNKLIYEKL